MVWSTQMKITNPVNQTSISESRVRRNEKLATEVLEVSENFSKIERKGIPSLVLAVMMTLKRQLMSS